MSRNWKRTVLPRYNWMWREETVRFHAKQSPKTDTFALNIDTG